MSNCYHYKAFGLQLAIDRPIPFLTETTPAPADCSIFLHDKTQLAAPPAWAKHTTPICCEWPSDTGGTVIRYTDPLSNGQMDCTLRAGGSRMDVWWSETVCEHDVIRVCTSVMIGRILHLMGKLALHANAVQLGESCILLAAPSGSGKSSTTVALLKAGAALLSDDISCIGIRHNQYFAAHGFAQLRLWPDTAAALLPENTVLPHVYQQTALVGDKRYWDLADRPDAFCDRDLPVRAIYILETRHTSTLAVRALPPQQAVAVLLKHLYLGQPARPDLWQAQFPMLVALSQRVPVFMLQLAEGLQRLECIHDFFLSHLREQQS